MSDPAKPKKTTLTDDDIKTTRGVGRRAFLLGAFGGTTALAGCVSTGITDADAGPHADPAGMGRGGVRRVSGITDRDTGYGADPAGNGRGRRGGGITDTDSGRFADPVGLGRGRRACTDSDLGAYADPVGRGRRC